ncbi:MAG: L,D-transpeptidase family protein [Pseudomonadota bacterium]
MSSYESRFGAPYGPRPLMVTPALLAALIMLPAAMATAAQALEVVVKGAAPDRIERQRREALGQLPLEKTPELPALRTRLTTGGHRLGDHVFIRIFKEESELEIWLKRGDQFVRFATYPVCFWSGELGPKLFEGDKQTPEGVYTVGRRQLRLIGRWPKSLNLWFPNAFDKQNERTGSYILIHGGCSSIGCYAMTDDVLNEVHLIVSRAIRRGRQRRVQVHAYPFRMTAENMKRHAGHRWHGFWRDLKAGYDLFETTRVPPQTGVCNKRYTFARATIAQSSNMAIRALRPRPRPVAVPEPSDAQTLARDPPDTLTCWQEPAPTDAEPGTPELPREAAIQGAAPNRVR